MGVNIPRPTDADRERFASVVPDQPDVTTRPMFGNVGAFVNGHMFLGLLGSDIGVRLDEPDRSALAAAPGAGPFGPAGRPMREYVTLPAGWSADEAERWVTKAYAAAAALPPKPVKPARKRTGRA